MNLKRIKQKRLSDGVNLSFSTEKSTRKQVGEMAKQIGGILDKLTRGDDNLAYLCQNESWVDTLFDVKFDMEQFATDY